jgi:hypothetical protein
LVRSKRAASFVFVGAARVLCLAAGTGSAQASLLFMNEPLPILMENAIQIAWNYLELTGQIDDPVYASRFLLDIVERMVRKGERRRLLLSNNAISAYQQAIEEKAA